MKKTFMAASLVAGLTLITSCSVKPSECETDYNNTIYRGRNTHNFIVINNKLDKILNDKLNKVIENQERIIKQNEEMLKILNNQ